MSTQKSVVSIHQHQTIRKKIFESHSQLHQKNKIHVNRFNQGGENCKTLMKESEEDINKWKNILYLWIG